MARPLSIALVLAATACGGSAAPTTSVAGDHGSVVAVLDGDSLRIDVAGTTVEVRLIGINAPEAGECWADESRVALESLAGSTVTVRGDDTDQYGRRLAVVATEDVVVNDEMVRLGHAIALDDGDEIAAETAAAVAGLGLWSPTACGPDSRSRVDIVDVVADPPGPDDADLGGEYAVLRNDGPAVDLTGWVLRDESSVHRFHFPDGFHLGAGESVLVHTGCGTDSPTDLHWCADGPVWNNDGDMALLLDRHGNVAARLRY